MNIVIMVLLAFVLDLLIGDPHPWPHPVKAIGRLIAVLTKKFNKPECSRKKRKYLGVATWLITVGGTGLVAYVVDFLSLREVKYAELLNRHVYLITQRVREVVIVVLDYHVLELGIYVAGDGFSVRA